MTKDELFKQKGELTFQLEMIQARLHDVNEKLVKIFNDENKLLNKKVFLGENQKGETNGIHPAKSNI